MREGEIKFGDKEGELVRGKIGILKRLIRLVNKRIKQSKEKEIEKIIKRTDKQKKWFERKGYLLVINETAKKAWLIFQSEYPDFSNIKIDSFPADVSKCCLRQPTGMHYQPAASL